MPRMATASANDRPRRSRSTARRCPTNRRSLGECARLEVRRPPRPAGRPSRKPAAGAPSTRAQLTRSTSVGSRPPASQQQTRDRGRPRRRATAAWERPHCRRRSRSRAPRARALVEAGCGGPGLRSGAVRGARRPGPARPVMEERRRAVGADLALLAQRRRQAPGSDRPARGIDRRRHAARRPSSLAGRASPGNSQAPIRARRLRRLGAVRLMLHRRPHPGTRRRRRLLFVPCVHPFRGGPGPASPTGAHVSCA